MQFLTPVFSNECIALKSAIQSGVCDFRVEVKNRNQLQGRKRDQMETSTDSFCGGFYDLWNVTDIVDGQGAGVMSVSLTVLPSELRTRVFSRAILPSLL